MSPRDNRPSISAASTQSPPPPSSSSSSSTNQAAAAAAAVVSNLADSIDTVADHFSPAHTIHQSVVQTSNQPANQLNKKQLSKKQPGSIASHSVSTIEANQEGISQSISEVINQPIKKGEEPADQLLMNETVITDSTGKNTLFGYTMPFDVISATYAALVATGGIIGYVKAGSIPSLAAGITFGGILGIGTYLTSVNPDNYYLTLATSTGLGGLMGYRFINSGKFMPAGLVALLSIGMVARFGIRALTSSGSVAHVKE